MPFFRRISLCAGCGRERKKDHMHCYCLFCETQRARHIAALIERVYEIRTISPIIMQREWKKGEYKEIERNLLPGYIFLYTENAIYPWFEFTGIIRWVGQDELTDQDLAFAQALYEAGGIIKPARLAEEGDCCVVTDPLWDKIQGTIVKVDRGRKRCCIAFDFDQQRRMVWVGYELVRPQET